MSQAFVRESEEQWLHEVQPTLRGLMVYLTRENNGIRVYELMNFIDPQKGKTIHVMSNGLSYSTDADSKWYILKETFKGHS